MSDTAIEWATGKWEPVGGCSRASTGCENCYAERLIGTRFAGNPGLRGRYDALTRPTSNGPRFTGAMTFWPDRLAEPMSRRKPTRYFVCSQSDLFHPGRPPRHIAAVLGVCVATDWHIHMLLTKRPDVMRLMMVGHLPAQCVQVAAAEARAGGESERLVNWLHRAVQTVEGKDWHDLQHIWCGVSAENQDAADKRIPVLLSVPAAKRFVSYEPAVGPVDLRGWGDAKAEPPPEDMPTTWSDFVWPGWVPAEQRKLIEDFWQGTWGRGPRQWAQDNHQQSTPATGARVGVSGDGIGWVCPAGDPGAALHGHYVHRWNNMGAVVCDDGIVHTVTSGMGPGWLSRWLQPDGEYRHRLHWIIAGCESGPGARHAPLDWVRSVRDQVLAARGGRERPLHGDPHLFVKQWDVCELPGFWRDGRHRQVDSAESCGSCGGSGQTGKVRKGCPALDGRVWAEVPA